MNYPTITVRQPWATLLAFEVKTYETRSWRCEHRGPLAIHASSMLHPDDRIWAQEDMNIARLLRECGYEDVTDLPLGTVLAVGTLTQCYRTEAFGVLSRTERALGDWSRGRWAWRIERVERLPEPVPAKGRLGLWHCEIDYHYRGGEAR